MKNLISEIKRIADENPDGFTVDLDLNPVEMKGFSVSLPETQNSFSDKDLEKVVQVVKQKGAFLGGWFNKDDCKYYFDASIIVQDLDEAIEIAKANKQIAIFDLENLRSIRVR